MKHNKVSIQTHSTSELNSREQTENHESVEEEILYYNLPQTVPYPLSLNLKRNSHFSQCYPIKKKNFLPSDNLTYTAKYHLKYCVRFRGLCF